MSNNDDEQKEFRGLLRQAWFDSSLERDKSILTLSSGAIGVLFIIVDKYPLNTKLRLALFLGALLAFIISLVSVICVFQANQTIVKFQLDGKKEISKLATVADWLMVVGFSLGVILSSLLTVLYAVDLYLKK